MASMTLMSLAMLAWVSGTFAAPAAAPASAAKENSEHFTLPINERGTKFNEEADVYHDAKTVVFSVPDHNTVSNSKVMLDFKNRKVMTLFIARKQCLLSDMSPDMAPFERVEEGFQLVTNPDVPTKVVRKITEETNQRVLLDPVYDRSFLSPEMQEMCAEYQMHRVDGIGEEPEIEEESDAGSSRVRRYLVLNCPPLMFKWRCSLRTNTCIYYYECDGTGRPGEVPSPTQCIQGHVFSGSAWQCVPFCP